MLQYPHSRLFNDPYRTVVLSGPHIQVLNTQNGRILHSTASLSRGDGNILIDGGPIRCSGMSVDGRYLATCGDDKKLKIVDLEAFTLLDSRELSKKPTSIEFTRSSDILVSDKFGDVFKFTLHRNSERVKGTSGDDNHISHENPSSGELVLGHASLLTSCLLTPDEKFIITADRDEHIRVSWYPESYVIESYCLGHKKYVSAIHIPAASPSILISGGGDPELKVWDWMTGRLQRNIAIYAAVEPFIKVTAKKRRHAAPDEGCNETDNLGNRRGNAKKAKRRCNVDLESEDSETHQQGSNETFNDVRIVLVIRRISSFSSENVIHVVFSAVGATAIFEFTLTETDDQPHIRHHDFGKPVIDFTICGEGLIWVLLDVNFHEGGDVSGERRSNLVQAIQWSADQRLVDAGNSTLLESLNTICSLPARADDVKTLDLYSDLSSLSKNTDGERESRDAKQIKPIHEPPDNFVGETTSISVGLTKRALGRQRHKRALDRLHQERVNGYDAPAPDTKKVRVDLDNRG